MTPGWYVYCCWNSLAWDGFTINNIVWLVFAVFFFWQLTIDSNGYWLFCYSNPENMETRFIPTLAGSNFLFETLCGFHFIYMYIYGGLDFLYPLGRVELLYEWFFEPQIVRNFGVDPPHFVVKPCLFEPYIFLQTFCRDPMFSGSFGGTAFCRNYILEFMKKAEVAL